MRIDHFGPANSERQIAKDNTYNTQQHSHKKLSNSS